MSLIDQLAQLKLTTDQIKYVGISHYHGDHIGQVSLFPKATLLIGKADWDALTAVKPNPGVDPAPFANWITGGGKVEPATLDKDVFGDGTVIMLDTPGPTHRFSLRTGKLRENFAKLTLDWLVLATGEA